MVKKNTHDTFEFFPGDTTLNRCHHGCVTVFLAMEMEIRFGKGPVCSEVALV